MVIVFSDIPSRKTSINAHETRAIVEAAELFGCRVFAIPSNFDECETAENALSYVPRFDEPTLCIWTGFIPSIERYQSIYEAARKKNVFLVNTPEQHRLAMEFDMFYPLIQDLTPKSVVIHDSTELAQVINQLVFPVFVKGAVKSNKDDGWSAVIANNLEELTNLVNQSFKRTHRSRGKVIIREMVELNAVAVDQNNFPIGREYRAFLYKGEILAYGFYWDEYDDSSPLSRKDKQTISSLLNEVGKRMDTPFISVDIGQLKNGDWIVIEIGDGQFSGLSQIPVLELWSKVKDFQL